MTAHSKKKLNNSATQSALKSCQILKIQHFKYIKTNNNNNNTKGS
jgi:hypothetical protein